MKHFVGLWLIMLLLCCTAMAQTIEWIQVKDSEGNLETVAYDNDMCFRKLEDGTIQIEHCYDYYASEVILPLKFDGMPVTSIAANAFGVCFNLTEIKLEKDSDIFTVVDGVLYNAQTKTLLCYPTGRSETSFTIPEGTLAIAESAFYGNDSLISIIIPDSVTTIGSMAFAYSRSLESIVIPDSVISIGEAAFGGCRNLKQIDVAPNNPVYASPNGILFDRSMTTLHVYPPCIPADDYTIPDGVTSIGNRAFAYNSKLASLTLPDSVSSIHPDAFVYFPGLMEINVTPDNPVFASQDGVLFDRSMETLYFYPMNKASAQYSIPDGVTSIEQSAFEQSINLTRITMPESVISIGEDAFISCKQLSSVTILGSIEAMGKLAFSNCNNLESVSFSNGVTSTEEQPFSIKEQTFSRCTKLKTITIPDGVTWIDSQAFADCTSLTSIYLPASIEGIDPDVFSGYKTPLIYVFSDSKAKEICTWRDWKYKIREDTK